MAQAAVHLPCTGETWMALLAPGSSLIQPWMLQKVNSEWKICFSLSLLLPFKKTLFLKI